MVRIGVRIGKRSVEIPSETDAVVRGGAAGGVAGFVGTSLIRRSKGEDRTGKRTDGKGNVERDIGEGTRVGSPREMQDHVSDVRDGHV